MHMKRTQILIGVGVLLAIVAVLAVATAFAQSQPQVAVSEAQARVAALGAFPGTVLETELDRYSGRVAYEFKIRPQNGGPADDVHVDATTGAVLGIGADNEPDSDYGLITRLRELTSLGRSRGSANAGMTFQDDFNLAGRTLTDTGEGRYFVLRPGFQTVLSDGQSQTVITVLNETKDVGGTLTRVVEERSEKGGVVEEIALNYYAIDANTGDAFYFGEAVDLFQSGVLTGHSGSWLAVDGNRAGLIMPGFPIVGMRYYQEVAPGQAMDRAEVLSTTETCRTPAGDFPACIAARETSAIDTADEVKYFAPGIGFIGDGKVRLTRYGYVDPGR